MGEQPTEAQELCIEPCYRNEPIEGNPLACATTAKHGHHAAEPKDSDGQFSEELQYPSTFHLTSPSFA